VKGDEKIQKKGGGVPIRRQGYTSRGIKKKETARLERLKRALMRNTLSNFLFGTQYQTRFHWQRRREGKSHATHGYRGGERKKQPLKPEAES